MQESQRFALILQARIANHKPSYRVQHLLLDTIEKLGQHPIWAKLSAEDRFRLLDEEIEKSSNPASVF